MKNVSFILFLCLCLSASAQEKKIQFTKIYTYELSEDLRDKSEIPSIKVFASNAGEFLTAIDVSYLPIKLYSDQIGTFPVEIGLSSKLKLNILSPYLGRNSYTAKEKVESKIEKLKTTQNISGLTCNDYSITYWKPSQNADKGKKVQLCIDEKNNVNNMPVFTGAFNQIEGPNAINFKVKGLILSIGEFEDSKEIIRLKSVANTNDYAFIDSRSERMNQQKKMDSLMAVYKLEEDTYNEEYAAVEMDSTVSVIDSAYAYDDQSLPPPMIDDRYEDMYIPEYRSQFKKNPDYTNYAIESISEEKLWISLPKHCREIEKDLPKLDNKVYRDHLKNFTGQMCDLYLSQLEINSVAVKATVDDVRRELLYFNENKEKLNKSDRRKVDKYFKNLD